MEKKALIIGFGVSGQSSAQALLKQGYSVTVTDIKPEPCQNIPNVEFVSPEDLDVSEFDIAILSPGVMPNDLAYQKTRASNCRIIGEAQFGLSLLKPITLLGITGTNGKTTVTLMVNHILNYAGINSVAIGNVGIPVTEFALKQNQEKVAVVELSSYQIDTLECQDFDAVVLLNVSPDHLDRYGTMESYANSKIKVLDHVKMSGESWIFESCIENWSSLLKGKNYKIFGYGNNCIIKSDLDHIIFEENIETFLPLEYRGRCSHNIENILAAFSLCRFLGISSQQFADGLAHFKKPSHRIEFVREHSGIRFFDDSKGTNIDAVMRAVESFKEPIVLIAGGLHKGCSYKTWLKPFKGRVKSIHAIGQASHQIKAELNEEIPVDVCVTLEDAVRSALNNAQKGDVVLLSPGCASWDMFKSYVHRGEEFKKIVGSL
ncbi:MAG: UDP-N-acetylmuramoyl-L-alanine--D-glutamate ligase [Parachlamydiales bacterium]|nr:UDP-N-acetylmuramoyl-L-alanine--D-glutamate ligase [Parachlamydiales bacterium]